MDVPARVLRLPQQRLLVAGHWLGLGQGRSWTKEEPFKLARIRLDIPNSADEDWKIDIRKSTARPPLEARQRLSLFAEDVRQRARRSLLFADRANAARGPVRFLPPGAPSGLRTACVTELTGTIPPLPLSWRKPVCSGTTSSQC